MDHGKRSISLSCRIVSRRTGNHFGGKCSRLVISNFPAIVTAAGGCRDDVIKVTAYIVGSTNWPALNRAFAEVFGERRPARSVVSEPELHHGYLIEIDGVALNTNDT